MSGVLVDTSVWVDHFRLRNDALIELLGQDLVLTHHLVWAEIACSTPPAPRAKTLAHLRLLQPAQEASLTEVVDFIEREKLYGQGCGLVDMVLLASTLITPGARLWTLDKPLGALSDRYRVMHSASVH